MGKSWGVETDNIPQYGSFLEPAQGDSVSKTAT